MQAKAQGGSARCTLRDLCAEDRAKVAKLIRQVVQAEQRVEEVAARAQRVRASSLAGRRTALCLAAGWAAACRTRGAAAARGRHKEAGQAARWARGVVAVCGPDRASAAQEAATRQAELEQLRARGSDVARENDRCPHQPGAGLPGEAPRSKRMSWPCLRRGSYIQADLTTS